MKLLYCIIHTKHQESRANNILKTWGKDQNIIFYSDHNEININCHKVTDQSDYASGQIKQINIFKLLLDKYHNYDWYFFCDNDTFVNTKQLNNFIQIADLNQVHGEMINCWPKDKSLIYPSGGAGFLMSNRILNLMIDLSYYNTEFGDVSLGLNLRNKNIKLKNSNLFHSQDPQFYNLSNESIKDNISFHYILNKDMMKNLQYYVNINNI